MTAVKRSTPVEPAPAAKPTRAERARRTRLRVIAAAHELFVERGYTGAKMTDIAAAAGVAVQTVYFTFHTKSELLQACYEVAVLGPDGKPPPLQPWWAEMMAASSGPEALRHFASGNTSIVSRVGALDDIVRSAAHEPEAVEVRRNAERLRREGYQRIVGHLEDDYGLADGLEAATAIDIMLTLGSSATYRALVLDYGWTETRFADWLAATLAQQLLRPSA